MQLQKIIEKVPWQSVMSGRTQSIIINLTASLVASYRWHIIRRNPSQLGIFRWHNPRFFSFHNTALENWTRAKTKELTVPEDGGLYKSSPFTVCQNCEVIPWTKWRTLSLYPPQEPDWTIKKKNNEQSTRAAFGANTADLGKMWCIFVFFIVFRQTNKRTSLKVHRKCWLRERMLEILSSLSHVPAIVPSLTNIKQMLSA